MPVQASAVPCERAFSSSKETDSNRRTNTSSSMIEMLQILKHLTQSERLDFMDGHLATEEECTVLDIDTAILREMLEQGQTRELHDLIEGSYNL